MSDFNLSKKDKRYLKKQNKTQRKEERKKEEEKMNVDIDNIDTRISKSNINLLLLLIRPILFIYLGIILMAITSSVSEIVLAPFWTYSVFIVNLITIIILLVVLYIQKIGLRSLVKYREKKFKPWQHALIILGFIALFLITSLAFEKAIFNTIGEINKPLTLSLSKIGTILMAFCLPITTIFAEDIFFFAYISNSVENTKANMFFIALMIIAQHMFFPLVLHVDFMAYRFLSMVFLFIAYLIFYRKTKNILPIIISHTLINLSTIVLMLI